MLLNLDLHSLETFGDDRRYDSDHLKIEYVNDLQDKFSQRSQIF